MTLQQKAYSSHRIKSLFVCGDAGISSDIVHGSGNASSSS